MVKFNNIIYALAFLPFLNFGIPLFNSDTQPFYFLIIVLVLTYNFKSLKLLKFEILLLFLAVIISMLSIMGGFDFKKSINLLIVVISVFYFLRNSFDVKLLRIILSIYCSFLIIWILFPSVAYQLQSLIVRNINTSVDTSFRGIPLLSTEPGLFSGLGIILIELFLNKLKGNIKKIDYFLISAMFIAVILSFSGSSLVFLSIFILVRLRIKLHYILLISLTLILIIYFSTEIINFLPQNRLSFFLTLILSGDLFVFLSDSSLIYRINSVSLAFDFFNDHILGAIQSNDVEAALQKIYSEKYYDPSLGLRPNYHLVSGFGYALISGGIFTILYYSTLLYKFFTFKGILYFSVCTLFSYSLIFPTSLILLIELSKSKTCVEY